MMKIGLYDKEFEHIKNPTRYHDHAFPEKVQWDRENPGSNKAIVYTERCYNEVSKHKGHINCAWALESPEVHGYAINDLKNGLHAQFDYIITHSREFIEWLRNHSHAKGIWYTPAGGWILKEHHRIFDKFKNIQIIASKKNFAPGHKLRHEVINSLGDYIDGIYGNAYKKFRYTLDVFKDFRYAIVIENCDHPDYFTDKLTSAFYTGTIPIMWNSGWIGKYFNTEGIVLWQTKKQLEHILPMIRGQRDFYEQHMGAIKDNFERAKKYFCPEDYLYNTFFKDFE